MKAIGSCFFGREGVSVLLTFEGKTPIFSTEFSLEEGDEVLKAGVLPMEFCKVRAYPMPDMREDWMAKTLFQRLEKEPLVDFKWMGMAFKKKSYGAEVHFYEKKALAALQETSDYVTSAYQALERYLTRFLFWERDLILLSFETNGIIAYHFCHGAIERYALLTKEELPHLFEEWGGEAFAIVGPYTSLLIEGKQELLLDKGEFAFAIGAAIDALQPLQGVALYQPLENPSFLEREGKKGVGAFFLSSVVALSCLVALENWRTQNENVFVAQKEIFRDLARFQEGSLFSPLKVSTILNELQQSIESYGLDVVEFNYSIDLVEKKSVGILTFALEGDEQEIKRYEQQIHKGRDNFWKKMEADPSFHPHGYRVEFPLRG